MKRCTECGGLIFTAAIKEQEDGVTVFYHWKCWAEPGSKEPDSYDPRLPRDGWENKDES